MSAVIQQCIAIYTNHPELGGAAQRAATFLLRQALEHEVAAVLGDDASASFKANLVLFRLQRGEEAGRRAALLWNELSEACHAYGHELPPTWKTVHGWRHALQEAIGT